MCGRVNVNDDAFTRGLMQSLGLSGKHLLTAADIAPASKVAIVREHHGERECVDAIWWLLLDPHTLKPNYRYASFNSRSDKLHVSRSASYRPFRTARCVIPVSGFVEGLGDKKHYFQLEGVQAALAMGGIYREWVHRETGEVCVSASIITLPGHPRLQAIHPKSTPLILPQHQTGLIDRWLDSSNDDVAAFAPLLQPHLPQPMKVTPIDRPGTRRAVAESFVLEADAS